MGDGDEVQRDSEVVGFDRGRSGVEKSEGRLEGTKDEKDIYVNRRNQNKGG